MQNPNQTYFDKLLKPETEPFKTYFIAKENRAYHHEYECLEDCTLTDAKTYAQHTLATNDDIVIVYVYDAYCPRCGATYDHCSLHQTHISRLQPATHLDYLAVYVDKTHSDYLSMGMEK